MATPTSYAKHTRYHGVLAPHFRWRRRAVAYEGAGVSLGEPAAASSTPGGPELPTDAPRTPRYWAWADLMRLLATIEDPRVIHRILAHLGLPTEVPRPPPVRAADFSYDIHA